MKEKDFDGWVSHMQEAPLPPCPVNVERNVLRRIRIKTEEETQSLLDWALGVIPRPGVVAAALALTIAVSSSIGILSTRAFADSRQSEIEASKALGFEVLQIQDVFDIHKR
ncbi:hypothetical protein [Puniceicoccus vermicola]|uniref:Uncharacterized protein n=1 Tax=Puniceicoccus vermicola TaxID=388746 RepID=A0A7X1B1J5_9BACT|nr:hypothetical protein [Puniceicoccus vermicola]MBC2603842.1 hypothetical protein [Puniceicoccus vermicola]